MSMRWRRRTKEDDEAAVRCAVALERIARALDLLATQHTDRATLEAAALGGLCAHGGFANAAQVVQAARDVIDERQEHM